MTLLNEFKLNRRDTLASFLEAYNFVGFYLACLCFTGELNLDRDS